MEKTILTPLQKQIIEEFSQSNLASSFYFTGGTALSAFYLQHRQSEDLDFFSEKNFQTEEVTRFVDRLGAKLNLNYRFTQIVETRIFEFVKNNKLLIKIDFGYYPYPRLEKGKMVENVTVDSKRDIATNKLISINQRTEVKDFVDLFFLLREDTLWDLLYCVEVKFHRKLDLVLIATNFLKVQQFDLLPRMIVPLKLTELKSFFLKRAEEIGKSITK